MAPVRFAALRAGFAVAGAPTRPTSRSPTAPRILAAMGEGETMIENYLDAADTRSTLEAMRVLGAGVAHEGRAWAGSRASGSAPPPAGRPIDVGKRGRR